MAEQRTRAWRRAQLQRMKRRAKLVGRLRAMEPAEHAEYETWFNTMANHLKDCSCWMCGNPRRYTGDITRQEAMANDELEHFDAAAPTASHTSGSD